ncbi:uncharacterized protein Tco025E_00550 [Trypanosoma conorhini]|uniref:SET domain-containing protein n=1 Tax=Trypanosoma conorhini TaxID=83891 RepID=A0A422QB82_9TRYP|nr:uncharacterized protein Tco025E_00550 [Trypanosoma conorhini]RNF27242.1 hypothetical protein Tco025E_00550 [Trypanosoma conorhini]
MRGQRAAKFAEYTATYAILKRLGLHDTVLIEKRDASVGYGVFVKDACDAGTPLLVVPSRRACAVTTLERLGANLRMVEAGALQKLQRLDDGALARLLGCTAGQWARLAWRLAIERQRALSPWWGWLSVLPSSPSFKTMEEGCERLCRLHHTALLPYLTDARRRIEDEVRAAHAIFSEENVVPSLPYFRGAVEVILSRAQHLPLCWTTAPGDPVELGILPFIDLINGDDGVDRRRNAAVEVAFAVEELPSWYRSWFVQESERGGVDGEKELQRLMEEHFFAVVVLERGLLAAEEVILEYELQPWGTGSLSPAEELLLGRLLRYFF